jgi:GNAT superfamily N-acetyltransferase
MVADYAIHIAHGRVHVATNADGMLQGFIVFIPQPDHMRLDTVAVRPEAAGCGVGKALIQFCEREARRLGFAAVRLSTNQKMLENQSIYPHLGYVEVDRRIDEGFHRVFYEKVLR